jgi:hypothetical protein
VTAVGLAVGAGGNALAGSAVDAVLESIQLLERNGRRYLADVGVIVSRDKQRC